MTHLVRYVFVAMLLMGASLPVASQSKFIVWPKEPGRFLRPAGTPGGQANALKQFDTFQIEEILVEGNPITIGQPFTASDDWLNDITIRIKNISQQTFGTIQVTLVLPEIEGGPYIPVCYGCAADQRGKGFGPGDEVELKTLRSEKFYSWVKTSIAEKRPLSTITTAQILLTLAKLPDGSSLLSECVRTANTINACPRAGAP